MKKVYSHCMIQAQSGYSVLLRSMWFPMPLYLKSILDLAGGGSPIGGRGVVLQKGVDVGEQDLPDELDDALFRQYRERWEMDGERFLAYVVTEEGLHLTFEVSHKAMLVEWVREVLASLEARKRFLTLVLATDGQVRDLLMDCLEVHWAHARDDAPEGTGTTELKVDRALHPLFGHVLFITLPAGVVQKRDLASFLRVIDGMASGLNKLTENWMSLRLNFEGWPADLRPHETPAIQGYMRGVMRAAPWWLALVHPSEYVKWFGCLVTPKQLRARKSGPRFQFKAETLRPLSGLAVMRAVHFLDSTEIEQSDVRNEMVFNLRMAVDQLERGEDLVASDPLCIEALKIVGR